MAVSKSVEDDEQICKSSKASSNSCFCPVWMLRDLGYSEPYKIRYKDKKRKISHLQSLNIHKKDSLILTHMVLYVFQMISVERGIEHTNLEKEASWEYEYRPPPSWPDEGWIYFINVNFRYSLDGPLVLKELEASIDPGEKVSLSHLPL